MLLDVFRWSPISVRLFYQSSITLKTWYPSLCSHTPICSVNLPKYSFKEKFSLFLSILRCKNARNNEGFSECVFHGRLWKVNMNNFLPWHHRCMPSIRRWARLPSLYLMIKTFIIHGKLAFWLCRKNAASWQAKSISITNHCSIIWQ